MSDGVCFGWHWQATACQWLSPPWAAFASQCRAPPAPSSRQARERDELRERAGGILRAGARLHRVHFPSVRPFYAGFVAHFAASYVMIATLAFARVPLFDVTDADVI